GPHVCVPLHGSVLRSDGIMANDTLEERLWQRRIRCFYCDPWVLISRLLSSPLVLHSRLFPRGDSSCAAPQLSQSLQRKACCTTKFWFLFAARRFSSGRG